MKKSARKPPAKRGANGAAEIYVAVGVALSWWEGSEDELMGLFRELCGDQEPTAFETYVASPEAAVVKC